MNPLATLDTSWQDLHYAARGLRKHPELLVITALSLGLGIGVNTTLFNIFNIIVLQKPTAVEPNRIVRIEPGNSNGISYLNYRDMRGGAAFAGTAITSITTLNLRTGNDTQQVLGLEVSGNFFQLLGVNPFFGRAFNAEESMPEREPRVAVLSYDSWQRHLQGDVGALGKTITLNGRPFTVIGILGRDYRAGMGFQVPEVYVPVSPMVAPNFGDRGHPTFQLIARLAPGVTRQQAEASFTSAAQALEAAWPVENKDFGRPAWAIPAFGPASLQGRASPPEFFITLAVPFVILGLLLLIACANVAGVLLARGAGRRHELAVRLALGASRGRLIRTLLAESLLLSAFGAAGGLLLTAWLGPLLTQIRIPNAPPLPRLPILADLNLVWYTLGIALLTCLMCGLIPALQSTRLTITPGLKQNPLIRGRKRLRSLMVVGQVAASALLLVTCLLFLRSLLYIEKVNPGFDVQHLLTAKITQAQSGLTEAQKDQFAGQMTERIEAIPGIVSVSYASLIPLGGDSVASQAKLKDRPEWRSPLTMLSNVGPRYFGTMGIPLLRGREFLATDRRGSPPVVIVNETFAKLAFPDGEALGKLVLAPTSNTPEPWREIVGIAADNKYEFLGEQPRPQFFLPFLQMGGRLILQARTAGPPALSIAAVKRAIAEQDVSVLAEVQTTKDATSLEFALRKISTIMLASMGALGVLLAMIGLYGVLSWDVSRRTAEIGIRMALGASQGAVRRMVLRDGLVLVGAGVSMGIAAAMLLLLPVKFFLAGVGTADPATIAAVAVLLMLVSVGASWFPVRRATRIDPITALRYD
jgi:putative ABC transport system permease protein